MFQIGFHATEKGAGHEVEILRAVRRDTEGMNRQVRHLEAAVELRNLFEYVPAFVKHRQPFFAGLVERRHPRIHAHQPLDALLVAHRHDPVQPDPAGTRERAQRPGESGSVDEVVQVDAHFRIEPFLAAQRRRGARHLHIQAARPRRVPPAPEKPVLERRHDDRVLSHDLAVQFPGADRHGFAQQPAVAVNSRSRYAIQPLGDVQPCHLQFQPLPRLQQGDRPPPVAEFAGVLVSRAADIQRDRLPPERGFIQRDPSVAVGIVAYAVGQLDLHQRNAPARLLVHEPDAEITARRFPAHGFSRSVFVHCRMFRAA